MKKEYKVTLIESDFDGNIFDSQDCIGNRSLKRIVDEGEDVVWSIRTGFIEGKDGILYHYESFNDKGESVSMMSDVEVGDEITFKECDEK